MPRLSKDLSLFALIVGLAGALVPLAAQQDEAEFTREAIGFFESEVRPLLHQNCGLCHNETTKTSGLAFTSREAVLAGGNRGPAAAPGDTRNSRLIKAVRYASALKMPPTGKLQQEEIAVLERWVEMGIPWPTAPVKVSAAASQHWSLHPIQRPTEPVVRDTSWVRNPIDGFVLARLEEKGIKPSAEAAKRTLVRRVTLDLLGLSPSPQEVEEFLADTRPDAYERVVDRLLESPHYGERWGRHWLDIGRYADSNGYNIDGPREIWMYRDWVIKALNRDMPFDQFVIEQIAGDMLPNPNKQQLVATGFHRNTLLNLEGGIDFEQYRVEAVVDRVSGTGAAFLGLTLGCARCHDHKYDPISQREFYRIYAFFNNIDELSGEFKDEAGRARAFEPILEFGEPGEYAARKAIRTQIEILEKELAEYGKTLLKGQADWEKNLDEEARTELKPRELALLQIPASERNEDQKKTLEKAFLRTHAAYVEREKGIAAVKDVEPKIKHTLVMRELPKPREAYIHLGGDFLRKGVTVTPGTLKALPPMPEKDRHTRLDFARWLVDPKNPLTPRVTVNRLWQRYFGRGIVSTENDFGTQGSPPTHPELLDWLASELIARDWSLKAMHRLIVSSATYRQSSQSRPELDDIDPDNQLLAHQNRLSLEAEIVRDAALSASGLLTSKIGGPSVFPPQPAGAGRVTQVDRKWTAAEDDDRYRRGIYTYFWRSAPHPGLMVFDAPNSMRACTRRNRSNSPLQALTLLNDEAHYEFAQGLARRVLKEGPSDNRERIDYAFRLALARPPKPAEADRLSDFLARQLDDFRTKPEAAEAVVPKDLPADADVPLLAAWSATSRVLLNLDEFITRE